VKSNAKREGYRGDQVTLPGDELHLGDILGLENWGSIGIRPFCQGLHNSRVTFVRQASGA